VQQTTSCSKNRGKQTAKSIAVCGTTPGADAIPEIIEEAKPVPPSAGQHGGAEFVTNVGVDGVRDGVYWLKPYRAGSSGFTEQIWLCSPLTVDALTSTSAGDEWGRLLAWKDRKGRHHKWVMPCSIEATEMSRTLRRKDVLVTNEPNALSALVRYLRDANPSIIARAVPTTGWHDDAFVLPQKVYGEPPGERFVLQADSTHALALEQRGTLDGWREYVAAPCAGNPRLVLALSCGFAGPCLGLTDNEGGGVHLRGSSSSGKTTALRVASSIFGPPGFMRTWNQTDNALGAVSALHSDLMLVLDEIGQLKSKDAGGLAYALANGEGRGRLNQESNMRAVAKYRLLFLSSGEVSLGDLVEAEGRRAMAGQNVRVIDLAADAGKGIGMFGRLPGGISPGAFADQLCAAARKHYGHALPAFLQGITVDTEAARARLKADRDALADEMASEHAGGQVRRVAQRFAQIGAAGELATSYGITGWSEGEARQAAKKCFQDWRAARGSEGNSEPDALLSQVRAFLEKHGESRFEPEGKPDKIIVRDRAGFRRKQGEDGEIYLVLPEAFKEIIKGHSQSWAISELVKAGWLKPGEKGKSSQKIWIPDFGKQARVYVIDGGKVHSSE
jgi:putative DNA primase/helicase